MGSGLAVKHERLLLLVLCLHGGLGNRIHLQSDRSLPVTDVSVFTAIMLLSRTTPSKGAGSKSGRTGDLPGDVFGLVQGSLRVIVCVAHVAHRLGQEGGVIQCTGLRASCVDGVYIPRHFPTGEKKNCTSDGARANITNNSGPINVGDSALAQKHGSVSLAKVYRHRTDAASACAPGHKNGAE
jgi:hypothetical protein